jgi:hypothetical protein
VPDDQQDAPRTSRSALYESIGIQLINAGLMTPAAVFVGEVRAAAGFRVSPREVSVAVTQMARSGQPIRAEGIAQLVSGARGDRSQRQQRNADDWRTLGALLTLRGLDGSPEGQRDFIGSARNFGGRNAGDRLLLQVAIALAELGVALDSETVGKVARRLAPSAADLDADDMPGLVQQELRLMRRDESRQRTKVRAQRRASAAENQARNEGTRRWKPGGRRRRKIKRLPEQRERRYE